MTNSYIKDVGLFVFSIEDTPDNIIKFIQNPDILVKTLEYVDKFSILQDIIFKNPSSKGYGIQRKYSDVIEKVKCCCYIKHKHLLGEVISISNNYFTMTYKEVLDLIEGKY